MELQFTRTFILELSVVKEPLNGGSQKKPQSEF